jgi:hypothetical protein
MKFTNLLLYLLFNPNGIFGLKIYHLATLMYMRIGSYAFTKKTRQVHRRFFDAIYALENKFLCAKNWS